MAKGQHIEDDSIRDIYSHDRVVHESAVVSDDAFVGGSAEWRDRVSRCPVEVHAGATIREGCTVHQGCDRPTIIGGGVLLMSQVHVGHDVQIGAGTEIAPHSTIGGCVTIGARCKIGMAVTVLPHITIGDGAVIGAGATVTHDVPAGEVWANPFAACELRWGTRLRKGLHSLLRYTVGGVS